MQMQFKQVPDGIYRIDITVEGEKQLGGYCWVVPSGGGRNEYYVMREEYLPPVQGVQDLTFHYDPSIPSSYSSLAEYVEIATTRIHDVYPGADVGQKAFKEQQTDWVLP